MCAQLLDPNLRDTLEAIHVAARVLGNEWKLTWSDATLGLQYLKWKQTEQCRQVRDSTTELPPSVCVLHDREFMEHLLHLVTLCDASYQRDLEAALEMCPMRREDVVESNFVSDVRHPAFILARDWVTGCLVLVVRGTKSVKDILTDMATTAEDFAGGHAHHGMAIAARRMYDLLLPVLKAVVPTTDGGRLILTGHSLGAGVAALLCLLLEKDFPNIHAYCFATPCCISMDLADQSRRLVTTVVNNQDIICKLSPQSFKRLVKQVNELDWKAQLRKDVDNNALASLLHDQARQMGVYDKADELMQSLSGHSQRLQDGMWSWWGRMREQLATAESEPGAAVQTDIPPPDIPDMHLPGTVLHLVDAKHDPLGKALQRSVRWPHQSWMCVRRPVRDMEEVQVTVSAVAEHLIPYYTSSMRHVIKYCSPAGSQGVLRDFRAVASANRL